MQNENSVKQHVYAVFLSDLVMFIKIAAYMVAFRNRYLVKSVNLAFMTCCYWPAYT